MKQPMKLLVITSILLWSMNGQAANLYKWVDKDGNVNYSQRPPPGSNYEKMTIKGSGTDTGSEAATEETGGASENSNKEQTDANPVLQQEQAKNTEIRRKNCEAAKKNLQAYTVFRRVRQPDGSVKILGDEERARLIEESKASIKEFCD